MAGALDADAVAALVGGVIEGAGDVVLRSVAALDVAGPDQLSFCTGGRWAAALAQTRAGAVILDDGAVPPGVTAIRHTHARWAFALAATALHPVSWPAPGADPRAAIAPDAAVDGVTVEPFAVIGAGAAIGAGSWIQAHAYVGAGAVLGARCRLMPGAVVLEGARLGDGVVLKPGAVVGADGFGVAMGPDGQLARVPHLGSVVLEDGVEIGANACVDRGALGATRVGAGTRTDNLVQIAHNVRIGAKSLLAAFAGVAGGAVLGKGVVMGGRAAVVDHVEVGDGVVLAALASASRDAPSGARLGGSPARPYGEWLRETAALRALPDALKRLDRIERALRKEQG